MESEDHCTPSSPLLFPSQRKRRTTASPSPEKRPKLSGTPIPKKDHAHFPGKLVRTLIPCTREEGARLLKTAKLLVSEFVSESQESHKDKKAGIQEDCMDMEAEAKEDHVDETFLSTYDENLVLCICGNVLSIGDKRVCVRAFCCHFVVSLGWFRISDWIGDASSENLCVYTRPSQ